MNKQDEFDLYSPMVMKYFTNPKNMGKIADADAVAIVGNPKCGDVMKVFLKISKRPVLKPKAKSQKPKAIPTGRQAKYEEYIEDIKVQTLGCGAAIATSSIATEIVKGKSLEEALKLSNREVTEKLGGLPKVKYHCSVLAEDGIKKAIENYLKKGKNDSAVI